MGAGAGWWGSTLTLAVERTGSLMLQTLVSASGQLEMSWRSGQLTRGSELARERRRARPPSLPTSHPSSPDEAGKEAEVGQQRAMVRHGRDGCCWIRK